MAIKDKVEKLEEKAQRKKKAKSYKPRAVLHAKDEADVKKVAEKFHKENPGERGPIIVYPEDMTKRK